MQKFKLILTTVLVLLLAEASVAVGTSEPPIRKGAPIMVQSYDANTKSVEVTLVNEPSVGPNYADVNDLVKAIGLTGAKASEVVKQPTSIKGVVYNLQTDLKLLNFHELKARLPEDLRKKVEADAKAKVQAEKSHTPKALKPKPQTKSK